MTGQSEFSYGDHLMARRPGFAHHGIYVSDDRVIDFGGFDPGSIHHNGVRPVTLQQFARGRKVEVVRHPSSGRMFGPKWLPGPLPPERIVAEAERLAEIGFAGKYTLFGSNCEHVANWCVTGNYFESLQIKKFFRAHAMAVTIMMLLARSKGHTTWWRVTCLALVGVSAIAVYQTQRAPYEFWDGVERSADMPPLGLALRGQPARGEAAVEFAARLGDGRVGEAGEQRARLVHGEPGAGRGVDVDERAQRHVQHHRRVLPAEPLTDGYGFVLYWRAETVPRMTDAGELRPSTAYLMGSHCHWQRSRSRG